MSTVALLYKRRSVGVPSPLPGFAADPSETIQGLCAIPNPTEEEMPRYPKPDDQKVTRHVGMAWTELPARREGDTPPLPSWRVWQPATLEWWAGLWTKPQATQWDQSGSTLWVLACLQDDLIAGRIEAARVSAEIRAHQDRHGLSGPKALLQLRWALPADDEPAPATPPRAKSAAARRAKLRIVERQCSR